MTAGAAQLRFIAGKGGVGRTTVTAARAQQAAEAGRRTLAVDATGSGDLARLLAPVGDSISDRLTLIDLTTVDALDHYLSLYLPVPGLTTRAVGPNGIGPLARIFDYVATAAPGVREILVIGKIGWEALHGGWDEVVVDAPATGHLVGLLEAPRAMAELVPLGPIADQSAWLQELLAGPATTIELVTTLDELPVTESLELWDRLRAETSTDVGTWILNRVPAVVSETGAAEAEAWSHKISSADDAGRVGSADGAEAAEAILGQVMRVAVARSRSAEAQRQRLAEAVAAATAPADPKLSMGAKPGMISIPEVAAGSALVTIRGVLAEAVDQAEDRR